MFHIKNVIAYNGNDLYGVMADIIPMSRRPCVEIWTDEVIMQSTIDCFGQSDDLLWKSRRFPTLDWRLHLTSFWQRR